MYSLKNLARMIRASLFGQSTEKVQRPGENRSEIFQSSQPGPYAIQMRNGKAVNAIGELVSRMNPTAFIPVEEFVYKSDLSDSEKARTISKEMWIHNVIELLKQIASKEYQLKSWVKNEVHDYCTFIETCCGFFDDVHMDDFLIKAGDLGLSDIQTRKISIATTAFKNFSDEYSGYEDPRQIVEDPKFPKVRRLAQEALDSLGVTQYLDPSKAILKDALLTYILWISKFSIESTQNGINSDHFQYLMCWFFRSKVEKIIADYQAYQITEEQVKILRELYDSLRAYKDKSQNEKELKIDNLEWQKIRALAKDAIRVFNYKQFPDEN